MMKIDQIRELNKNIKGLENQILKHIKIYEKKSHRILYEKIEKIVIQ